LDRFPESANTALVVLAVLGVMAALHLMQAILVPVALAILLACLLSPLVRVLRWALPVSSTGAAVVLFIALTAGGLVLAFLTADSLEQAARTLPADAERLAGKLSQQVASIAREKPYLRGILPDPGTIDELGDRNRFLLMTGLRNRLSRMWVGVAEGLMVLVLVLFLLAESEMLTPRTIRFFSRTPRDAESSERTFKAIVRKIRAYLMTWTLLNVLLGLAVAGSLRLLNVRFAIILGGLTAVASFIPYVGQVASGVVVFLVALAHSGSLGDALIVAAVYVALVGFSGYVLTPVVLGRSLDLNGTTVLLACLFWGFLWGLVGLVLAIPITVSLKVVFQEVPGLHRWAELMSRDWQTPTDVAAIPRVVEPGEPKDHRAELPPAVAARSD
jgi:predicted PurR-regulated permease PerM